MAKRKNAAQARKIRAMLEGNQERMTSLGVLRGFRWQEARKGQVEKSKRTVRSPRDCP